MRTLFENRLNRDRILLSLTEKEKSLLETLPGYDETFREYEENISNNEGLLGAYSVNTKGITIQKAELRKQLSQTGLDFSSRLVAFAKMHGDCKLLAEIRICKSSIAKKSDNGLISTMETILQRAKNFNGELHSFGISDEYILQFDRIIAQFREKIVDPGIAKTNKAKIRKEMEESMKKGNELVEKIGLMMNMIRVSNPEVYASYLQARRIPNTGRTRFAFHGSISEAGTGIPLQGVKIQITGPEKNTKPVAELVTAVKGHFRLKSLPVGSYDFLAVRKGYQNLSGSFTILEKQPLILELEMERE